MAWVLSGTNGGGNPASLGVTPHCVGSERVRPGVSRAGRLRWRCRCETGCRSRGSPRSITLRVGEVVDLIIDLTAQPDELMTLPRADWADCLLRITLDAKDTPKLWEGSCGVGSRGS